MCATLGSESGRRGPLTGVAQDGSDPKAALDDNSAFWPRLTAGVDAGACTLSRLGMSVAGGSRWRWLGSVETAVIRGRVGGRVGSHDRRGWLYGWQNPYQVFITASHGPLRAARRAQRELVMKDQGHRKGPSLR